MIKQIQTIGILIPKGALYGTNPINPIDITKTTVVLNGTSVLLHVVDGNIVPITTTAYVYNLTTDTLFLAWSVRVLDGVYAESGYVSATIIEYI